MPARNIQMIPKSEYISMPWQNGGGTMCEIAIDYGDDDTNNGRYLWRAGTAEISADGPFSVFQGYDRIITLTGGKGVLLDAGAKGQINLDKPRRPQPFSGDWDVTATLFDGPVNVFNIVNDRTRTKASVLVTDAPALSGKVLPESAQILIHNLSEEPLKAEYADGTNLQLAQGDTMILNNFPQTLPKFSQDACEQKLILVQIEILVSK